MPEPACCSEVRRRLIRHGLPAPRVERLVEELSEHWTELRDAAWQEGLSDAEASARADADLGTPAHLTEEAVAALRRSSWLGRLRPILRAETSLWVFRSLGG